MRTVVVCNEPLTHESMCSLLAGLDHVELVRTDGSARAAATMARQGGHLAIMVWPDGLTRDEVEVLHVCGQEPRVHVIALIGAAGAQNWVSKVARVAVRRSEGLQGLLRVLERLGVANAKEVLSMAPPVGRPRRAMTLTRREAEVVGLVAQGRSNRQIADMLGLREQSVKNLVSGIMRKLRCENRVQLALQFSTEPTKIAG